MRALLIHFSG